MLSKQPPSPQSGSAAATKPQAKGLGGLDIPSAQQIEQVAKKAQKEAFLFFRDDVTVAEVHVDETAYAEKRKNLIRLIQRQGYAIFALLLLVIAILPFVHPINNYYTRVPGTEVQPETLVALDEPNTTDQAVLSWAATAITEIMTFGFGDIDERIVSQEDRFTPEGWDSFVKVLREQKMRSEFKMRQLVLTTVPADLPVIAAKGIDEDGDYTWVVEMPVVMTYTTNNNVSSDKREIVRLTIARIAAKGDKPGIGIKMWKRM